MGLERVHELLERLLVGTEIRHFGRSRAGFQSQARTARSRRGLQPRRTGAAGRPRRRRSCCRRRARRPPSPSRAVEAFLRATAPARASSRSARPRRERASPRRPACCARAPGRRPSSAGRSTRGRSRHVDARGHALHGRIVAQSEVRADGGHVRFARRRRRRLEPLRAQEGRAARGRGAILQRAQRRQVVVVVAGLSRTRVSAHHCATSLVDECSQVSS